MLCSKVGPRFFSRYECVTRVWPIRRRLILEHGDHSPTIGFHEYNLLLVSWIHWKCHCNIRSFFISGLKSVKWSLKFTYGSDKATFAVRSAFSFPGIPMCPGIQQKIIWHFEVSLWYSIRVLRMKILSIFLLLRFCRIADITYMS